MTAAPIVRRRVTSLIETMHVSMCYIWSLTISLSIHGPIFPLSVYKLCCRRGNARLYLSIKNLVKLIVGHLELELYSLYSDMNRTIHLYSLLNHSRGLLVVTSARHITYLLVRDVLSQRFAQCRKTLKVVHSLKMALFDGPSHSYIVKTAIDPS